MDLVANYASDGFATDPAPESEMLFGCLLDGRGGARPVTRSEALTWTPCEGDTVLWLHLDRSHPTVENLLQTLIAPPDATLEALLSGETRPRAFRNGDGLVTVLRGINFNPGAEPEDMIALHVHATSRRVITLRRRRLQTPRDVLAELYAGEGPCTAGDLVTRLIEQLVSKMNVAIVNMNDIIDEFEINGIDPGNSRQLTELANIRHNCLALKRYMSPQREALSQLLKTPPPWFSEDNLTDIRETVERLTRYLEEVDISKESAIVLQDDLNNRAASKMNQTIYMLSLVTAIFLPLSFLTGLLGINVGGIPGVHSHIAFWVVTGLLCLLLCAQVYLFRRLKWI